MKNVNAVNINAVYITPEPLVRFECGDHNRFKELGSHMTAMYCPVIQDKEGKVLEHNDSNTFTTTYECLECGKVWERIRRGDNLSFKEIRQCQEPR